MKRYLLCMAVVSLGCFLAACNRQPNIPLTAPSVCANAEAPGHEDSSGIADHEPAAESSSQVGDETDDRARTAGLKPDSQYPLAIGGKSPDFAVSIDGKIRKLSELQQNQALTADGAIVLTFWCSFCDSCREVEHDLDALAKEFKGKAAVIAIDSSFGETAKGVAEFAEKHQLQLPIALDADGTVADVFGAKATTTTIILDADGVLRYRGQFATRDHQFARKALQAVLAQEDVATQETRQRG